MPDAPPAGYVTSAEACRRLGISDRTLRRRVRAGTLDGEYVPRPQGSVLYVRLPTEGAQRDAAEQTAGVGGAASGQGDAPVGADVADTAFALVLELTAVRERADQLADRVAALEREAGRLEGRAAAAEAERDRLAAELAQLRRRRWWRWWW